MGSPENKKSNIQIKIFFDDNTVYLLPKEPNEGQCNCPLMQHFLHTRLRGLKKKCSRWHLENDRKSGTGEEIAKKDFDGGR